jgi:hypothetical protein
MGVFSVLNKKMKTGISNMVVGASNIIRRPLRNVKGLKKRGLDFHFRKAGERRLVTFKKYEKMIEYLRGLNEQLVKVETNFGNIENEWIPKIEELYRACGPYMDPQVDVDPDNNLIMFEQKYASDGTMFDQENNKRRKDFDIKDIKINKQKFEFKMPPAKPVYFERDGRTEMVTYFGYSEGGDFWVKEFERLINDVCDHADKKVETTVKDAKERERKKRYIVDVKKIFSKKINYLFAETQYSGRSQSIGGYEKQFHTNYLRTEVYDKIIKDYSSLKTEIMKIVPEKIKYKHTYKTAVPVLRGYDGKVKDKLENYGINPPVDKRGRPWEVDEKGKILIKPAAGGPTQARLVPPHMIRDEDLLRISEWVVNEYDSYRDDLRDGRYHPESLTVTDYIMANHPAAGGEWEIRDEKEIRTDKNNRNNDFRKYVMRLHDGRTIEGIRRADNLNPAFDLRAFEPETKGRVGVAIKHKVKMWNDSSKVEEWDWFHTGRKYYYADCEEINTEEQDYPVVTTRGISMFLIDKFLSEGELMDEVHQDLKAIGGKVGFDYGPRAFGGPFCKDPFDVDISSASESIKYKKGH